MTPFVVDIPCDAAQIDATGMPWAFLDDAARADVITKGAIVFTGDAGDRCSHASRRSLHGTPESRST